MLDKTERYWEETLDYSKSSEELAATGAIAEQMRLERIEVIVVDPETPADVKDVFQRILPQERFHARAFEKLAGGADSEAMSSQRAAHERGMKAIGVIPRDAISVILPVCLIKSGRWVHWTTQH